MFEEPCTQAMGCASEIFEREGQQYLIGCFGSRTIDGELYRVLTSKYKVGTICDACIEDNKQDFELLKGNQYYGIDL